MNANDTKIFVSKYGGKLGEGFTRREIADSNIHPGRRTDGSQTRASWVGDLTELKKCIVLCSYCRVHFNPRKHHYRKLYIADPSTKTDGYQANGMCDACKQQTTNAGGGTAFVHEEHYQSVCVDPVVARRQARAASKAVSVSFFLGRS